MSVIGKAILTACLCFGTGGNVLAQAMPREQGSTADRARQIATQPARDVGLQRTTIPPVLERAAANPYGLAGIGTCAGLSAAIGELNGALGPDFDAPPAPAVGRRQQVAEAGGRAVVDSVIPFRGLVREVSGSASAERRLQAAINAGIARRGFLRGLAQARGCRAGR